MPRLRIDGKEVVVPEGATLLDAAALLGIEIPAMCFDAECEPSTSCLLCVVRVSGSDRLVPSCATVAKEGMEVESETAEIHEARRISLELLLGDHLGECLAPCHRICPLSLNIPLMTRQIRDGDFDAAAANVRGAIPFPGILGRVCPAKCEVGCRRRAADEAVSIRNIERHVAEGSPSYLPDCAPDSGRRVAVVGGGPAGLAAAYYLRISGHAVTLFERDGTPGGRLRHAYDEETLPREVLTRELGIVERLGAEVLSETEVGTGAGPVIDSLLEEYDAVVVAAAGVEGVTGRPNLFPAGDAVRKTDDPARAMASGKDAAADVHAFFAGPEGEAPPRPFSTVVGKLTDPEMALYLAGAEDHEPVARPGEPTADHSREAIALECARCLRCDCRGTETCRLKLYAETLGASHTRFRAKRRIFAQKLDHPFVVFEPGKCIACGNCVSITRKMREDLGLTFIGRGFEVRIGVPFDAPLTDALREAAKRVVDHCPTGALEFMDEISDTIVRDPKQ